MAPNYGHVRTNWVTCDLPCVGPPVVKEGTRGDEGPCALRETTAECVFLTASQISSGTLSVPAKRAEAIFSLACAESDAAARVVVAMEHIDEDEEGGGVDAGEEEDGTPNVLIPIREPFSPSRVEGQSALPPPCLTPLTHTIRDDNKVVVWDSSASKGYLVKLRKFASQPTQVFLNGLHPLFDGLEVTARCAVCFFPTGVLGHAQAVVAHAGAVDGMYSRIAAGVVHEWGPSGVRKGNAGDCIRRVSGVNEVGGGNDIRDSMGHMCLVPLQRVLRVRTVADDGGGGTLQGDGGRGLSLGACEVAVVDARFGCFVRNVDGDVRGPEACSAGSPRVTVVDSCALSRSAYLRKRALESPSQQRGDFMARDNAKNSQSRPKRRLVRTDESENAPRSCGRQARGPRGLESSGATASEQRRAFGAVNERRLAQSDDGQKSTGTTLILKQRRSPQSRRRNARKATKPIQTL